MGSVYKKAVTKPLPPDAEIVTKKKGQCAQWKNRRGKTYSAPITTGRDGKPRIRVEAKTYTAKYRDGLGVVHEHATGCRGKRAAEMVLAKLEEEAEKVKAGVLTSVESEMSKHRDTPLLEHVDEYITHQSAKGVNAQRVKSTKSRLLRLAEQCNLRRLTDISADALERWMLEKAEHDDRTKKPMGAGARNGYRESAIGFGNWLVKKKRIPANPFSDVPKADANVDCRRKRRALNEDELRRLLDVARLRPVENAMTIRRGSNKGQLKANLRPEVRERLERLGRERALIYKTMALTGLRKKELTTLMIGWLELDADPPHCPTVQCPDRPAPNPRPRPEGCGHPEERLSRPDGRHPRPAAHLWHDALGRRSQAEDGPGGDAALVDRPDDERLHRPGTVGRGRGDRIAARPAHRPGRGEPTASAFSARRAKERRFSVCTRVCTNHGAPWAIWDNSCQNGSPGRSAARIVVSRRKVLL
jgi:hypothetical protein